MSSHATEGAEPAAEPKREPAAGAADSAAPAESVPAGTVPAEGTPPRTAAPGAVPAEAVPAQGRAAEPKTTQPKTTQPRTTQPKATQPRTTQPKAGQPKTTQPKTTPPKAARFEHGTDEAADATPGAVTPDGSSPELAAADAGARTLVLDPATEHDGYADEPVSKLAVAALATSVVALIPVAVGFGIAALAGIRRSGRRGRGMAVGALLVCAAWLIVAGAVGTIGLLTHGFHKPVTIKYREAAVFKLQAGDCINAPNGRLVSILPCDTPHEAEVFATFSLPGTAWPGMATVAREASSGCGDRLSGYLNPQLAISLTQSYVYPDKVAWTAGTRTVICEVRATSGQLTSSVRGGSLRRLT